MNDSELYRKVFIFNCTLISCLASLAKWLSVCLRTKWSWVRIKLLSVIFPFLLSSKWCSQNESISQFTPLQPHLYAKIHGHVLTEALENDDEQHSN